MMRYQTSSVRLRKSVWFRVNNNPSSGLECVHGNSQIGGLLTRDRDDRTWLVLFSLSLCWWWWWWPVEPGLGVLSGRATSCRGGRCVGDVRPTWMWGMFDSGAQGRSVCDVSCINCLRVVRVFDDEEEEAGRIASLLMRVFDGQYF